MVFENYPKVAWCVVFIKPSAVVHRFRFGDMSFKRARSGWQGRCYHLMSFTELSLLFLEKQFFLRFPMAGTPVTVLLWRLRGKRPWEKFAAQNINIFGWLEWLWPVREHCFRCVHSLEGNWRRHQTLYKLTNLELNFRMHLLFSSLLTLDQWTRRESPLLM